MTETSSAQTPTAGDGAAVLRLSGGRRTEKIAEKVARQILRDIQRKGLQPGATLPPESVMLERFDVGRGSLREALRILEVNGLVTIKTGPGGGPIVAAHDPRNYGQMSTLHLQSIGATYRQLLDARIEYEAMLARMAADRNGADAGRQVREAMTLSQRIDEGEDVSYASVTTGFHATVCTAGGNPVLALAANSIQSIWASRVTTVLFSPEDRPVVFEQHEAITQAIEKHRGTRAERLMREHLQLYREYCEVRYPARMDDVVDWS